MQHEVANMAGTLEGQYQPWLVVLSLVVAIFSATMSLKLAQLARRAERPLYRHVATVTGSLALAGGIWSMHFIGMLAYVLPARVGFDLALTMGSFLPACAAAWPALRILARPNVSLGALITAGLLVGLGIGTMHYSGMAAVHSSLGMSYDPIMFGVSILVAGGLSILALWIKYGLRSTTLKSIQRFYVSGVTMGLAIAGMHYTGMAAVHFSGTPEEAAHLYPITPAVASVVLAVVAVLLTLLVFASNDLIRSRELYRRLEESESRLRATLDTTVDAIITVNTRGIIQQVNHSVEKIFGWTPDALIGQHISALMPEAAQARRAMRPDDDFSAGVQRMLGVEQEVYGERRDGTAVALRLAVGMIEHGGEMAFVAFMTDISERRALEESLRETADRAERAAAAKSTFLANMSHEIRTPMNSIIGFTELLLQGELSATQRAHLQTVRQSSRSLLGLINDILDTTRLEKDGLVLESIDFSLKALAMQIESTLRLGAQNKGLYLTTHYAPDLPEHFQGDPLRVLQVLTNLVGNAIKFTERGGVDVRFSKVGGQVLIQVQDTGIGMSDEQVANIFAPFTQADATISRRFGGTGLGTTIASQLVELMGGEIRVTSQLGQGSEFSVQLPLPVGTAAAAGDASATDIALPPLRVLAADDVPQNLKLLCATLSRDGHTLVCAKDGADAVQRFKTEQFDLVMLDLHMPGTDGLEAARHIRQIERDEARHATPILALTASVLKEDRRAARQAGMDGFAVKPLDLPALKREMARVLEGRHAAMPTPSATDLAMATPRDVPTVSVDWDSALRLWGTRGRLLRAIAAFAEGILEQHPVLTAGHGHIDRNQVVSALHAVRGAAGNLGLLQVAQIAHTLEQAWRQCPPGTTGPAMDSLREALRAVDILLEQEQHAGDLARYTSEFAVVAARPGGEKRSTRVEARAEHRAVSRAVVPPDDAARVAMTRLRQTLSRSEVDDQTLDLICRWAEHHDLGANVSRLRQSIEAFDFAHGLTELEDLARHLEHATAGSPERTECVA